MHTNVFKFTEVLWKGDYYTLIDKGFTKLKQLVHGHPSYYYVSSYSEGQQISRCAKKNHAPYYFNTV